MDIPWKEWFGILNGHKRLLLLLTAAFAALAIAVAVFLPGMYTAETTLLPPQQNATGAELMGLGEIGSSGSGTLALATGAGLLKNPADLYVSILKSRTVEDAVVKRFSLRARYHKKLDDDARKALEKHVKVTLGEKDGIISIDVTDRDRFAAANIANGYVEEYRKVSANMALTEASQRRVFFQQQMLENEQKETAAEQALEATQHSTGILQVDSQTKALIEEAAGLQAQIVIKQAELKSIATYATPDNPERQRVQEELDALEHQMSQLGGSGDIGGPLVAEGKIPAGGMEYLEKVRDVKYYETIQELLAREYEMARLDEARQGAIIQVIDTAVPPERESWPMRPLLAVLGVIFGFLLACGFVIGRVELMHRKVTLHS